MLKLKDFVDSLPLSDTDLKSFCADPVGYLRRNDFKTDGLPAATAPLTPEEVAQISLVRELRELLDTKAIDPEDAPVEDPQTPQDPESEAPQPTPLAAPPATTATGPAAPIESFAPAQMAESASQPQQVGLPFPEFEAAFRKRTDTHRQARIAESGALTAGQAGPGDPCGDALPDAASGGGVTLRSIIGTPEHGSQDMTAEAIILADDRVQVTDSTATPYNWLCRLEITAANGSRWLGTGWFISPSIIVTAGHCVFLHNHGGWVQSIAVYVGQNQTQVARSFTAVHYATTSGWVNNRDTVHDYGVIFAPPGDQGFFGYGVMSDGMLNGALANVTGYPQDKPSGTLWGHVKRLLPPQPTILQYEIDTFGGMSGAPVVLWDGQDYIVTGIHNYGGAQLNTASRLTETVFHNFERWKALAGASN